MIIKTNSIEKYYRKGKLLQDFEKIKIDEIELLPNSIWSCISEEQYLAKEFGKMILIDNRIQSINFDGFTISGFERIENNNKIFFQKLKVITKNPPEIFKFYKNGIHKKKVKFENVTNFSVTYNVNIEYLQANTARRFLMWDPKIQIESDYIEIIGAEIMGNGIVEKGFHEDMECVKQIIRIYYDRRKRRPK